VKLGLSLTVFTEDVNKPLDAAARAAAAGYDAVFAPDHLFPPGRPDRPSLEPFALLSAIAAANPGLGVGVLVTRAGYRPVGMVAKQAAALDHLTGGRAVLGLGLGDAAGRAEHDALGLPYPPAAVRAEMLEETAAALRALFAGDQWAGGRHVPPLRGPLLPPGSPPVWVGGGGARAIAVAARAADGWNGWGLDPDGFEERARSLASLAREAGRDPSAVPPTWAGITLVGETPQELRALERDREAKGLPMEIWRGTVDDLRTFAGRLEAIGTTWMVCLAAGSPDRLDVIAGALRDR
jgi:alkanesulfonate monooxygenase SsuD/methylene tetrahydromethanopterin reductase-like flavin-dependent oxidoreductase (luciferase family)